MKIVNGLMFCAAFLISVPLVACSDRHRQPAEAGELYFFVEGPDYVVKDDGVYEEYSSGDVGANSSVFHSMMNFTKADIYEVLPLVCHDVKRVAVMEVSPLEASIFSWSRNGAVVGHREASFTPGDLKTLKSQCNPAGYIHF